MRSQHDECVSKEGSPIAKKNSLYNWLEHKQDKKNTYSMTQ